jgi:hypothetical protein
MADQTNPVRQAMDKILGIITPESSETGASRPIIYSSKLPEAPQGGITTTPRDTSTVGQSGPVVDPFAGFNEELAAIKAKNAALAQQLGGGSSGGGETLTGKAFTPGEERMWPVSTAQGGSADLPDWFRQAREWQEYWQKTPSGWIQLERSQMTPSILAARKQGPDAIIPFGRGTGPQMDQRIGYLGAKGAWEAANPGKTAPANAYTGDAASGKAQAIAGERLSRQSNQAETYDQARKRLLS